MATTTQTGWTKVALIAVGMVLGIFVAAEYRDTERQMTHKCVRWEVEEFEDFDGDLHSAEVCASDVRIERKHGLALVAISVPMRFFSGYTVYGQSQGYEGSGRPSGEWWEGVVFFGAIGAGIVALYLIIRLFRRRKRAEPKLYE